MNLLTSRCCPFAICWLLAVLFMPLVASGDPPRKSKAPRTAPAPNAIEVGREMAPAGFVELVVKGLLQDGDSFILVLVTLDDQSALTMGIGGTEGHSIALRHFKRKFVRPLTHDLLDDLLHKMGGAVSKLHIHSLVKGTYHGALFVRVGDRRLTLDSRPSDGIALALAAGAPIFVATKVLKEAGVPNPLRDRPAPSDPSDLQWDPSETLKL